jgi:multiple antibiotic resistance protein
LAYSQSTGVLATKRPITWGMIFALLFLMLGPIKLLGPFAAATKDCDRVFRLRLATRAFLFSAAAVTVAGVLGEQMLDNFAIPVHVLQIAAGLILFLVALQAVMHQYEVTHPTDHTEPPTLALAFTPLAFPTIVTPYGIAAVTILMALAPTTEIRLMLAGVVYFILFLDWLTMARWKRLSGSHALWPATSRRSSVGENHTKAIVCRSAIRAQSKTRWIG